MEDIDPQIEFRIRTSDGDGALVAVSGELDIASVDELDAAVAPLLEAGPVGLVVDVSDLRFADSSAIALWVRWAAMVGDLELRHCSPLLRRVIESMGLEQTLRLTP